MIAADYLRCSQTDSEHKDRAQEVLRNLRKIIAEDNYMAYPGSALGERIANKILAHMMLSCYSLPGQQPLTERGGR
jgi:hypothetical protein